MTNQKPQQDWEKAIRDILPKSGCTATYDEECYYHDAHKPNFWDDEVNKLVNLISTERQRVIDEVRDVVEGLDSYYVLNGNITKHKGGHLLDKDYLLQALNELEGKDEFCPCGNLKANESDVCEECL